MGKKKRITASRRENPYSGKIRGQVRVKTRLRCRTSQGKYKVMNYVDKTHLEWNTDPWQAQAQDTNIYLNAQRCSGRNTRTPVHQEVVSSTPDLTSSPQLTEAEKALTRSQSGIGAGVALTATLSNLHTRIQPQLCGRLLDSWPPPRAESPLIREGR